MDNGYTFIITELTRLLENIGGGGGIIRSTKGFNLRDGLTVKTIIWRFKWKGLVFRTIGLVTIKKGQSLYNGIKAMSQHDLNETMDKSMLLFDKLK
jgi:hypothetical protein